MRPSSPGDDSIVASSTAAEPPDTTPPLKTTTTANNASSGSGEPSRPTLPKKLRKCLDDDDDDDGGQDRANLLPSLPDDVLARIFRQVGDPKTLAALSCVCKTWRASLPESGAWIHLCEEAGRVPRRPRKPWRDLCLDNLRRHKAQVEHDHELLILRLTMDPRKGGKGRGGAREDVGAMRCDRPRRLRKMLTALAGGGRG